MAAIREASELMKRVESEVRPVFINGQPKIRASIAARARLLADYLEGRPDDEPEKIRLTPLLACLHAGQEPPAGLETK